MSGEILVIWDQYSYTVSVPCALVGHTAGSANLNNSGENNFVSIDGNLVVPINTTQDSSCTMGCTMTIKSTPNNFVFINGVKISVNSSEGDMGSCHPEVTLPSNFQNKWVKIS